MTFVSRKLVESLELRVFFFCAKATTDQMAWVADFLGGSPTEKIFSKAIPIEYNEDWCELISIGNVMAPHSVAFFPYFNQTAKKPVAANIAQRVAMCHQKFNGQPGWGGAWLRSSC